jgi:hypothetical protein
MIPLTNADYYTEPDVCVIRTEQPEPLRDGEITALVASIDRGFRYFCHKRGMNPGPVFFRRNNQQNT